MTTLATILLAAGQGTRMQSKKQKILHEVGGKPMVSHIFEAAEAVSDVRPVLVVGVGGDGVRQLIGERAQYAMQSEQLGTGHATMMAQPLLQGQTDQVIVAYGDMPLLKASTLRQLADLQAESGSPIVMSTVIGEEATTFGRIVRADDGRVLEILEYTQATQRPNPEKWLAIRELNVGLYCFDAAWLWAHLDKIPVTQARNGPEYYLTDLIEIAVTQGQRVEAVILDDADECLGAGTRQEMVAVEQAFRRRAVNHWLAHGVTIVDPATTFIDPDVQIGGDTVIWPNSYLQGQTVIGADCTIGPNAIVRDSQVGDGSHIEQAVVENQTIAEGTRLRPFTHLSRSEGDE